MVTKVGNLNVFWNGRIFVGPDWKSLAVSFMLILLPSVLFLGLVGGRIGPGTFWFSFLLVTFCLTMLCLTAFSNPGVIPRRPRPTNGSRDARYAPYQRTKDFPINGYTVTTKYCTTCHIYRLPRCSHCAMCDNCIEKFDHYCPWVGTCIGRRNYRYFLLFVFSATLLCVTVFSASLSRLVKLAEQHHHSFEKAIQKEPMAIILIIYTFVAAWFVGGLSVFHSYLVATNQTTYEHFRRRFGRNGNPYDKGVLKNIVETCFRLNPPYGWEGDGSLRGVASARQSLELPAGVITDPTLAAMQNATKLVSASQELPPRVPSSYISEKLGTKPMSPCSFGTHTYRTHSSTREGELSSIDYQESIYTTASSNLEDHIQSRLPAVTHQSVQSSFLLDVDPTVQEEEVQREASMEPKSEGDVNNDESVEEQEGGGVAVQAKLEETEGGAAVAVSIPQDVLVEAESAGSSSQRRPPPSRSSSGKESLKLKAYMDYDPEKYEELKHGPNPFAQENPMGLGDEGVEGGKGPEAQPAEQRPSSLPVLTSIAVEQSEKGPGSPTASVGDSQKGGQSPKVVRSREGGFHGMMAGLTRGRYTELKELPPQSSSGSETRASESQASIAKSSMDASQGQSFRVPDFGATKIGAAIISLGKSAAGHLTDRPRSKSSVGEGNVGIAAGSSGHSVHSRSSSVEDQVNAESVEVKGLEESVPEKGDEQRGSWRVVLRRGRKHNSDVIHDRMNGDQNVDNDDNDEQGDVLL